MEFTKKNQMEFKELKNKMSDIKKKKKLIGWAE